MKTLTATSWRVQTFDPIVEHYSLAITSFTEEEALKASHWDHGEDALLREDIRFRPTPWGRWILSSHLLANDILYRHLRDSALTELGLVQSLSELQKVTGHPLMFCSADDRFVYEHDKVRLAASELSDRPKIEDPLDIEKYETYLPLHSLEAVAASEPAGEWGPGAQEELIETLGWIRVILPGQRLNDKMFVAQIKGNSMDNGKNGLTNGVYAVFQLWPVGTRQGKIVLVKGTFTDPETGAFALKKYVADTRDEEGRHNIIKLVSLNPDKNKFPDITLTSEQDGDVSIVAELISPLLPDDYGREPKPKTRTNRRDLTSRDAKIKISERLEISIQKFFDEKIPDWPDAGEELGADNLQWFSWFICMDDLSGGLHIETGPLTDLPPFVKTLQIQSGSEVWKAIASNLRNKLWRVHVSPSSEPYHFSAPGYDDVLEEELTSLSIDGLWAEAATPFRIDAGGVGRALEGNILSPGQSYRVLIPPALSDLALPEGSAANLERGWRLLELSVPSIPDTSLKEMLSSIGFGIGKSAPQLSWVIIPPALYKTAPSGETYPCFEKGQSPILRVEGIQSLYDGEVAVFLAGSSGMKSLPLPQSDSWTIELTDLDPGKYIVEVLHNRTSFEPVRLPFVVEETVDQGRSANVTLQVNGTIHDVSARGIVQLLGGPSLLEIADKSPEVIGPPLWPVHVGWKSGRSTTINIKHLDEGGRLDFERLGKLTEDLRHRSRIADLYIDFRELGKAILQMDRITDPEVLIEQIRQFIVGKAESIEGLLGQNQLLRAMWLDPIVKILNYGIKEIEPDALQDAPLGVTPIKLYDTFRSTQIDIKEELHRLLILARPEHDLKERKAGSIREYAERLCLKYSIKEAILTDGLRWVIHKRGSSLHKEWDLRDILRDSEIFDFMGFLFSCAVGV